MSRVRSSQVLLAALVALLFLTTGAPRGVEPASAATCASHSTQAAAQAAKDTRDGDGDGVYCESLPCPCAGPGSGGSAPSTPKPKPTPTPPAPTPSARGTAADPRGCSVVKRVVDIGLSKTRYPAVRRHWDDAIARGYPRILTVHRAGAGKRRDRLLNGVKGASGMDRDEYPMAMARTSVHADVQLVDSSQNRGAGSVQGIKLRRYCSGQRFQIVWY